MRPTGGWLGQKADSLAQVWTTAEQHGARRNGRWTSTNNFDWRLYERFSVRVEQELRVHVSLAAAESSSEIEHWAARVLDQQETQQTHTHTHTHTQWRASLTDSPRCFYFFHAISSHVNWTFSTCFSHRTHTFFRDRGWWRRQPNNHPMCEHYIA